MLTGISVKLMSELSRAHERRSVMWVVGWSNFRFYGKSSFAFPLLRRCRSRLALGPPGSNPVSRWHVIYHSSRSPHTIKLHTIFHTSIRHGTEQNLCQPDVCRNKHLYEWQVGGDGTSERREQDGESENLKCWRKWAIIHSDIPCYSSHDSRWIDRFLTRVWKKIEWLTVDKAGLDRSGD